MINSKVRVLVACHKPDKVFHNDVYIPIHVGRSESIYKDEMSDMVGDDTGDNISKKNPYYCELTAQYWAWKNMRDTEYIGLCHYRRYFETEITVDNIDSILGGHYDVLLVRPFYEKISVMTRLRLATCSEDFYIFYQSFLKLFPTYKQSLDSFIHNNKVVPFNMFLMSRELFDSFSSWQFSVLQEMEKYVHLSGYTRCRRLYGYMAEIMLPVFCQENHLRVRYDNWVPFVGEKANLTIKYKLSRTLRKLIFKIWPENSPMDIKAIKVGLMADGINI